MDRMAEEAKHAKESRADHGEEGSMGERFKGRGDECCREVVGARERVGP